MKFMSVVISCFGCLSLQVFLHVKNQARKMNHQEVVEEDRRSKLPSNWEAKQRQVEWEEEQEQLKKVCVFIFRVPVT